VHLRLHHCAHHFLHHGDVLDDVGHGHAAGALGRRERAGGLHFDNSVHVLSR
jgi:hypothetical protein